MSEDWPWSSTANLEFFGMLAFIVVGTMALVALCWWLTGVWADHVSQKEDRRR